ncbi:hypothetical protein ABW20_dc0109647 [Dactylellina cionopaga]|nr:hypothetical protein ABW20_dc0109647 [Dactylellina cionopaga]
MELQKHLRANTTWAPKGMPLSILEYPRDFQPFYSQIETTPRHLQKEQQRTNVATRPEDQNIGEQNVFTLTGQPYEEGGEDDSDEEVEGWLSTPPEQLKNWGAPRAGDINVEDSDNESHLASQPPPASSMEQPAEPLQRALGPSKRPVLEQEAPESQNPHIESSARPALPKSSPPKARTRGVVLPSSPGASSPPGPVTPLQEIPKSSDSEHSTPSLIHRQLEASTQQQSLTDHGTMMDTSDFDDDISEGEVQVMQTQSEFAPDERRESAEEEQEAQGPASTARVISSSQLVRPTTPTSSPSMNKRKADEIASSPVKAGSMASPRPRIMRDTKVAKVDITLQRNLENLKKVIRTPTPTFSTE